MGSEVDLKIDALGPLKNDRAREVGLATSTIADGLPVACLAALLEGK